MVFKDFYTFLKVLKRFLYEDRTRKYDMINIPYTYALVLSTDYGILNYKHYFGHRQ